MAAARGAGTGCAWKKQQAYRQLRRLRGVDEKAGARELVQVVCTYGASLAEKTEDL